MKLKVFTKYFILLVFTCLAILTLTYKVAGFLSLYPNDWFLNEKIYRKDPRFFEEKNFAHRFICNLEDQAEFAPYSKDFSKLLNFQVSILRNHKHRTVFLIEIEGKKYLLKRYNIKHFYHWLQRASIRSSQAYRSWHYGHELLKLGILTPKPLALYEKRVGPFWTTSFVVTQYLEGNLGLHLQFQNFSKEEGLEVLQKLHEELKILEHAHFIHSDYGFRNFLVQNKKTYIIDLDDLHRYRSRNYFFQKRFTKKHQEQLMRDLDPYLFP